MDYNSGFRILYKTEMKDKRLGILMHFEDLDEIRWHKMKDWYLGHESLGSNKESRTQCVFDGKGNFVDFAIYRSMGQRYHVEAATFVSPSLEQLEAIVKSFELPFIRKHVVKNVKERWE